MKITETHVYFWRGPFSNWRMCDIVDFQTGNSKLSFRNSEQAFMFHKAVFFRDTQTSLLIYKDGVNPETAKFLGRHIANFDIMAWKCVCKGFMVYVNYLKYSQNEDLKKILLETEDRILVEASPLDNIWGVGLGEDDPLILDEKNWKGENLLGKALMEVRNMVK